MEALGSVGARNMERRQGICLAAVPSFAPISSASQTEKGVATLPHCSTGAVRGEWSPRASLCLGHTAAGKISKGNPLQPLPLAL